MPADPQEVDGARKSTCVAEWGSSGSGARLAGVNVYQLGKCRQVNPLLSFLICKMGTVYPYLAGGCEGQMGGYVRCPQARPLARAELGEEVPRRCCVGLSGPLGMPMAAHRTPSRQDNLALCLLKEVRPAFYEFS